MERRLWCAIVGCPDHAALPRAGGGFMPDGQELPDWMSWSAYVTTIDGEAVTTGTIITLPLPYYGPSIPLAEGWTYGGLTSPTPTTTDVPSESSSTGTSTIPSSPSSPSVSPSSTQPPSTTQSSSAPSSTTSSTSASSSSPSASFSSSLSASSSSLSASSSLSSASSSLSAASSLSQASSSNTTPPLTTSPPTSSTTAPLSSSSSSDYPWPAAGTFNSGVKLGTVLPAVLVPLFAVVIAAFILLWCLNKRRDEAEAERTAAFRYSKTRFSYVPTTDPDEKLPRDATPDSPPTLPLPETGGSFVVLSRPNEDGTLSPVTEEDDVRSGDEHTTLLAEHEKDPLYAQAGMTPTGGAIAGLALFRSLGLGSRRPSNASSHSRSSAGSSARTGSSRNVSGNTMERMIGLGLVSTTSIAKRSFWSNQSGSGSGSGSGRGGGNSGSGGTRSASGETAAKRSSGATSTGAYIPVGDEELFYHVPRAQDSTTTTTDNGDTYWSADSGPPTGSSGEKAEDHVRGEHGSLGSNSGSSSGGSRRSGRSAASKASSGGGGPRVSTIPEEGVFAAASAAALATIGVATLGEEYDLGRDTDSPGPSQYDSAGSGSASGRSTGPVAPTGNISEFGIHTPPRANRRERRRDRTANRPPPTTELFARRSWVERNNSVGTFGTNGEGDNRASADLYASTRNSIQNPALFWAAQGSPRGTQGSPRGTLSSSSHARPSTDHMVLDLPAIMLARSTSMEGGTPPRTPTGATSLRGGSMDRPLPPLPTMPSATQAGPLRYNPYAFPTRLIAPLPGLNRAMPAPAPLASGLSSSALIGGDMMLSPFGLEGEDAPELAFGRFPSEALAPPRLAPTGASRSVGDLLTMSPRPSETVSSFGEQLRQPRVKVYNEFGTIQEQASKSAPTLFGGPPIGTLVGTQSSHDTSGSSNIGTSTLSSHEQPGWARYPLRDRWNPYIYETSLTLSPTGSPTRSPQRPSPGVRSLHISSSLPSLPTSTPSASPSSYQTATVPQPLPVPQPQPTVFPPRNMTTPPPMGEMLQGTGATPSRRELRELLHGGFSDDSSDEVMGAAPAPPQRGGLFGWMRRREQR